MPQWARIAARAILSLAKSSQRCYRVPLGRLGTTPCNFHRRQIGAQVLRTLYHAVTTNDEMATKPCGPLFENSIN